MYNNDKKVTVGFPLNVVETSPDNDFKYGPYSSVDAALNALGENGSDCICAGLKFGVKQSDGSLKEYRFKKGIANASDLICEEDLINQLKGIIGELSFLSTSAKSSIVEAINEVKSQGGSSGNVQIVDNLTSTSVTSGLSANQGKVLKGLIDNLTNSLNTLIGTGDVTAAIDSFNEIKEFLDSYSNTQGLSDILNTLERNIKTWSGQQGYLTSYQQLKTINGQSIVGSGNINVEAPISNAYTKTESDGRYVKQTDFNDIKNKVNLLADNTGTVSGLSVSSLTLLGTILSDAVYASDQTANIAALKNALATEGREPTVITYNVSSNLTNCNNSNKNTSIEEGSQYRGTITAVTGYVMSTVTVVMGDTDITNSVYSNGTINIPSVTGNIVITAVAIVKETPSVPTYTVTNNLSHATTTNAAATVEENSTYEATINAETGYELETVTVMMGGVNITSTAYSNKKITINSVTGNIIITVTTSAIVQTNNIPFEDSKTKETLVNSTDPVIDKNGDGEISYEEAASATWLPSGFNKNNYGSFNEFQYFTKIAVGNYSGNDQWYNNTGLTSLRLHNKTTGLGWRCFRGCSNLESINLENITSISAEAFFGCSKLNTVLPEGLTTIGDTAFYACYNLAIDTIPSTVTSIGSGAFAACGKMRKVKLLSNSVPTLGAPHTLGNTFSSTSEIYVKDELLEAYKTAENWSTIADKIKPLSEWVD